MKTQNIPYLFYNWISGTGAVLASISFLIAVALLLLSVFSSLPSPYLGIVVYVFLPAVIVFGLLLIPLGMWITSRGLKERRLWERPAWPRIDFNQRRVRNGALVFVIGATVYRRHACGDQRASSGDHWPIAGQRSVAHDLFREVRHLRHTRLAGPSAKARANPDNLQTVRALYRLPTGAVLEI